MPAENPDWLGADKAKRAETFRGYKEKFGGVFDKDQKNLQESVYDELVATEYITGVIAAADPSIKAFPVSGLLKIAFNEAFSTDLPKAKKLMFDCLDYLESAAENQDGKNINLVDISEGVEVYKDTGGRWKLRVGKISDDKKTITEVRIDRFLFPKKEDVVDTSGGAAPAPAPVAPELTAVERAKIVEYKNDVLQKLKLIFGDTVSSLDQAISFDGLDFKYENNLSDADWLSNEQYFRISATYNGNAIRLFIAPYGSSPVYKPDDADPESDGEELADVDAIKGYITERKTTIDAAPPAPADEFTYALSSDGNALQVTQTGKAPETFTITKDADIKLALVADGADNYVQVTANIGGTEYTSFFEFGSNYTDLEDGIIAGKSSIWGKYSIELSGKEIIIKSKTVPAPTPEPAPAPAPAPAPEPAPVEPELTAEEVAKMAEHKAGVLAKLKEFFGDIVVSLDQAIPFEGVNFKYENNLINISWAAGEGYFQLSASYNGGKILLLIDDAGEYRIYQQSSAPDVAPDTGLADIEEVTAYVVERKEAIDEAAPIAKKNQEGVLNQLKKFGVKTFEDVITIEGMQFKRASDENGSLDVELWKDGSDAFEFETIYKGEKILLCVAKSAPYDFYSYRGADASVSKKDLVLADIKAEKEEIDKWESTYMPERMAGVTAKIVELGGTDLKSPLIINGLLFTPPAEGSEDAIDTLGKWMNDNASLHFISPEGILFGINLKSPHEFVDPSRSKIEPNDKTGVENYVKAVQRKIGVKNVLKSLGVDIDAARTHWSTQLADLEFRPISNNGGLAKDNDWLTDGNKFLMVADYKGVELNFGVTVAEPHDLVNTNGEKFADAASLEAYIDKRKKAVDDWESTELPKAQEIVLGNIKELGGEKWDDKITIEDIEFSKADNNGGLDTVGKWMRATRQGENYSFYNFRADYKGVALWFGVSVVKPGSFNLLKMSSPDTTLVRVWQGEGASELKSQVEKLKEEIDKEKPAEAAK